MTGSGQFPKIDGDILYAMEVNHFQNPLKVYYSGTGYNVTQTGAGTTSGSIEIGFINISGLNDANFLQVSILGSAIADLGTAARNTYVYLNILTKELSGGAWTDSLPAVAILNVDATNSNPCQVRTIYPLTWYHPLTTAELTSGIQIMVKADAVVEDDGGGSTGHTAAFKNIQTVVKLS